MPPADAFGEIDRAARLLRAGRLVAFPTETVYGLGANALDAEAVARIYAVKRRPPTSPLIVHVASIEMAQSLATNWPRNADLLATKFWPGPLTLVLTKSRVGADAFGRPAEQSESPRLLGNVPDIVTAGLSTVAVRMPAHPIASSPHPRRWPSRCRPQRQPLHRTFSGTTADHVRRSLGSDVDLILDGGPCQIGIESTVLSLAEAQPTLLRPGIIPRTALESIIGPVALAQDPPTGAHPAPGMHARHYSPRTPLFLTTNGNIPEHGQGIYLQHEHAPSRTGGNVAIHQMPQSAPDYAAALYEVLHRADAGNYDWIAVDVPPSSPDWDAVVDRLKRAAWQG
jgi:L-threonylcarbamoyladenylate synthase